MQDTCVRARQGVASGGCAVRCPRVVRATDQDMSAGEGRSTRAYAHEHRQKANDPTQAERRLGAGAWSCQGRSR